MHGLIVDMNRVLPQMIVGGPMSIHGLWVLVRDYFYRGSNSDEGYGRPVVVGGFHSETSANGGNRAGYYRYVKYNDGQRTEFGSRYKTIMNGGRQVTDGLICW